MYTPIFDFKNRWSSENFRNFPKQPTDSCVSGDGSHIKECVESCYRSAYRCVDGNILFSTQFWLYGPYNISLTY